MPFAIARNPVDSRPLNHWLVSLTPSGNELELQISNETEFPSYTPSLQASTVSVAFVGDGVIMRSLHRV